MLVNRLVQAYLTYDLRQEDPIVERMEKECGEEWGERIKSIGQLFLKDRARFQERRSISLASEDMNKTVGGLVPLVIAEDAWPFQDRNSKILIHPELMRLASSFELDYFSESTKNRLWWTSQAGNAILAVSFKFSRRDFLVSVDAANLLLYLEKGPKKLAHFVCEYGYALDQV
jgi:hypothetical protein